ncbi:hypothetical protein PG994_001181 [Apiospora phragmitis]|uniref:Uncharacterized protein n=1 Tax=Apiospora phragmitis TaxID=2905665 RepID=A0ABR1WSV3_9PEZI
MSTDTGNSGSWSTTPASKLGTDASCAVEEGHSTPNEVREWRSYIQQMKRERCARLNCKPDPALQTVCGFKVCYQMAAAAAAVFAADRRAAEKASASMNPSELTIAFITSLNQINQAAMRRNQAINAASTSTKSLTTSKNISFAGVAPPIPRRRRRTS